MKDQENTDLGDTSVVETRVSDADMSSSPIEETPLETIPEIGQESAISSDAPQEERITTTKEDCEALYGCALETIHGVIALGKGKPHRGIPEDRRKAQGLLLYNICMKYSITIPAELDVLILGGGIIADWQYMAAGEEDHQRINETDTESKTIKIDPQMGGVITDDTAAKAANHNSDNED